MQTSGEYTGRTKRSNSERLRVLIWHWGRKGGGPLYTYELTRALAMDATLDVYTSLSKQSELYATSQALRLPGHAVSTYTGAASALLRSCTLPLVRRRFRDYLQQSAIDVVLCTMSHVWNRWVMTIPQQLGIPLIATLHDATLHPGENTLAARRLLNQEIGVADRLIVLSEHVRTQLLNSAPTYRDRIHVIPHGAFRFDESAVPVRALPTDRPVRLLFLGRLLRYKGLELLLDAYAALSRERALALHIAGAGDLSPYKSRLQGLSGITLTNRWLTENEIGAILTQADIMIAPYTEASQSGVIAAAYGAGLPVVATPVGGLLEQVQHGTTGLIAASVDADGLANALRTLMQDQSLYAQCSRAAHQTALTTLGWHTVAAQTADVLRLAASARAWH